MKLSRYHRRAHPFVLESHGRPGAWARSLIRRFAAEGGECAGADAATAWCELSSVLQAANADIELAAYPAGALTNAVATIWTP